MEVGKDQLPRRHGYAGRAVDPRIAGAARVVSSLRVTAPAAVAEAS
jgi:hypothetical protein